MEARVLMHPDIYNKLLAIVIENPEKQALNERVWAGLSSLIQELIKPMPNPANEAERVAKSEVVQDRATAFVAAFTDVAEVENATHYCHEAVVHLPEMVRETPVDLLEVSQQALEHALKQGKIDMRDFTNKQLRGEKMDLGRNQQVMAKERERFHLQHPVEMPLLRNVRMQLGDGSKEMEQSVARAERKGLLVSRSQQQIEKQVEKGKEKREELKEAILEHRLTLLPILEEEAPPAEAVPPIFTAALVEGGLQPENISASVAGDRTVPSASTIGSSGGRAWSSKGRGRSEGCRQKQGGRQRGRPQRKG
jgi:hypothetical protein